MIFLKNFQVFFCGVLLLPAINCFNFGFSAKSLIKVPADLQIDPVGYFDIVEKPEQFLEINTQIVSLKDYFEKIHIPRLKFCISTPFRLRTQKETWLANHLPTFSIC